MALVRLTAQTRCAWAEVFRPTRHGLPGESELALTDGRLDPLVVGHLTAALFVWESFTSNAILSTEIALP